MPWNVSDPFVPPLWNDWGTVPWFVMVAIGIFALVGRRHRLPETAMRAFNRSERSQIALVDTAESN
jgi:hypothetical protein